MTRRGCEARQYPDQMNCQRCGLYWDMNDPDPPDCLTAAEVSLEATRKALAVTPAALPASLETLEDARRAYAEAVTFIASRGLASEFYTATRRKP